jgi:predicted O-linked N-acetylglucosamine transferase (SPINDLY family)
VREETALADHGEVQMLKLFPWKSATREAKALVGAGFAAQTAGDLPTARRHYESALRADPANADASFLLGVLEAEAGRLETALPLVEQAVRADPGNASFHFSRGRMLAAMGRTEQAAAAFGEAVNRDPGMGEAFLGLGLAQLQLGNAEAAEAALRRAVEADPALAEAHANLSGLALTRHHPGAAEEACRRCLALRPDHQGALLNLGTALQLQGRLEEARDTQRRLVAMNPGDLTAWSSLLLIGNYTDMPAQALFREHQQAGHHLPPPRDATSLHRPARPDRGRLRIGYVSPDFRNHVVSMFFEPVLEQHDRDRFEIVCYNNARNADEVTRRLRAKADLWRDIAAMDDDAVERLMLDDELDVVVDLAGHTANNRLAVLARRVAPVQVNWLGYPNTTGLPAMDWRITDARADPAPEADALHTERLYRMPEVFLNWRPHPESPEVAPAPCLAAGHVTFCSFNNFAKVSDHVLGLWARILAQQADARLLMKTLSLTDPSVQEAARRRLEQAGCDLSRVVFSGAVPSMAGHLGTYARADIALDTYPYHGTTTTCEALWMGVPVITLAGDRHASRVGVSLLESVGAGELVARSDQEYVDKAVALARDPQRIVAWRNSLRSRILASPLADSARFARDLEDAYRSLHSGSLM